MTTAAFDAVDWNYWQTSVAFAALSRHGDVRQTRRFVLADIGAPVADFNLALVSDPEADLEAALDAAEAFFGAKQHPWRVSFRAEHVAACEPGLLERGFTAVDPVPGMQLAPLPERVPVRSDITFEPVSNAATLKDFQQTAFLGFGLPAQAAHLFLTEQLVGLPSFRALVGYVAGEPVCTSAVHETAGVAGIYWVATVEAHRKKGLGEAATWAAVAEGRRRGHTLTSLQASVMGKPVYARMGFAHDRSYARYQAPARPSAG
jgi:GNAT superfamily N-acetyltransferase